MAADPVNLSIIEDRIIADSNVEYKDGLIKKLEGELQALKNKKNSGLSPDEFNQVDSLILAIEESIKVVELTWFRHHKTQG